MIAIERIYPATPARVFARIDAAHTSVSIATVTGTDCPKPGGWHHGRRSSDAKSGGPTMEQSTQSIAERFFGAIERGDLEAVRDLYAPDVRVWHNVTGRTQTRDQNLQLLTFFASRVAERRYEILGRDHFPGGFVQRHVLHGKLASGEAVAAPVCIVIYVADGKIRELFEYLDPETVRAAFA
jgi:ketosteroid isomerase-like protein